MIIKENYLGKIYITEDYIKSLVSQAVSECIGVAKLDAVNLKDFILSEIFGIKVPGIGVETKIIDNEVLVSVYISAVYGINLMTVIKSVKNKVYFVLSDTAGIPVRSVSVYVSHVNN
ncbi:MAG: Asp23/Gls24 family envelope stress response protein [Clostridium sp.]|nr:Asp23/Gls24 family envelope stress response protein [Clostridium sp.]MCM1547489.1 Asp23/Gls24 family envelope stress response protein [Ruminococcus sp.]